MTWRSATTTNALIAIAAAVGPSSGILSLAGTSRPFVISRVVTIALAVLATGLLIAERSHPRLPVVRLLFVLPAIPVLFMNWFLAPERVGQGLPMELFVREAIASAVYALAAPPEVILSVLPVAAFSMESLLVYGMARWSHPSQVPRFEPWTSLIYATGVTSLALYRARRQQREVATVVKLEQAAALRRLMRGYLAVRDLINTPLQTLRISAHLLATRCPGARQVTDSIERAVKRLDQLNDLLAEGASTVEWPPGSESFDPLAVLRASRSKPES
ncbi:MAG TPA: hypothetical protein VEK07_20900 [Polyangiaceae bacterium]|nr:hypothetical protein [Polyangiaceae bacterium]